jgi:hypothetical protein
MAHFSTVITKVPGGGGSIRILAGKNMNIFFGVLAGKWETPVSKEL